MAASSTMPTSCCTAWDVTEKYGCTSACVLSAACVYWARFARSTQKNAAFCANSRAHSAAAGVSTTTPTGTFSLNIRFASRRLRFVSCMISSARSISSREDTMGSATRRLPATPARSSAANWLCSSWGCARL